LNWTNNNELDEQQRTMALQPKQQKQAPFWFCSFLFV